MSDTVPCLVWWYNPETTTYRGPARGRFCVEPESRLLENVLWEAVREAEAEERFRTAFTVTVPLWYGLWMYSPVTPEQCSVLLDVATLIQWREPYEQKYWERLQQVLAAGKEGSIVLEVNLAPPGHVDFGVSTIFAHCPRCKAEAPDLRWTKLESYPEKLICPVCNLCYSPANTFSQENDEDSPGEEGNKKEGREVGCLFFLFDRNIGCLFVWLDLFRDLLVPTWMRRPEAPRAFVQRQKR